MRAVGEIAHHHWSYKAAQIAYSVDQSDGGGGSRLAEKQRGHRPENRLKAVKRATRDNKKTDGNYQVRTVNNCQGKRQPAHENRNRRVPAAVAHAVRVPAIHLLRDECRD